MVNRNQCDTTDPCDIVGQGTNGCMTNLKSVGIGNHLLLPQAAEDFKDMVNDMPEDIKNSMKLSDSYRPLKIQCNFLDWSHYEKTKIRRKKGTSGVPVAYPGTSNHGWGRAIDVSPKKVQDWIKKNGEKYNWCWGEVRVEPWHFTYCGGGPHRSPTCDRICKNVDKTDRYVAGDETEQKVKKTTYGLSQTAYKGEAANNINMIVSKLKQRGITDPITQVGILSVIGKESGFIPQNEKGYNTTSNERIRRIFSSTKKLDDSELNKLKSNEKDFFNYVYGPKGVGKGLGNTQDGDGYKFIGRGFNQITGRANYRKYGFESNPESLNDPEKAADAMIDFLAKEGSSLNNKFDSVKESIEFFVTRNAGGKKSPNGEIKALEVASKFNVGEVDGSSYDYEEERVFDDEDDDENSDGGQFLSFKDLLTQINSLNPNQNTDTITEEIDKIGSLIRKVL